ncbi:site-specific integrase [Pseudomonas sp. BN102]|uniref:site-specific integrase n=1 Tax=Pseudomonas sp. BN102 TaxID=2567886 RepID=UPI002454BB76|nr:site-specific integrase [Pseudomonas sp. BN102]MDH4610426.1 site-specific integrase [Pseudomonas sp. BN102]
MNNPQELNAILNDDLYRTQRPDDTVSEFFWDEDILRNINGTNLDMTGELSALTASLKSSFKAAAIKFSAKGDYSPSTLDRCFSLIRLSLRHHPASEFNSTWTATLLGLRSYAKKINPIRRFFIFWKEQDPLAIKEDALQLLIKSKPRGDKSCNVLSDDPELSWLTDSEYDSLTTKIWRYYENKVFSAQRTLILLLSMQYARRPIQLAQLKIGDFRIAIAGDPSGLTGFVVDFPGVKDITAKDSFRDSKIETHPLPDHLWSLFETHRHTLQQLYNDKLGIQLTGSDLKKLPAFTKASRIGDAINTLANHYSIDWKDQLDHKAFHLLGRSITKITSWRTADRDNSRWELPISERTGLPLVVNATRLRHTRARQLARKGVPRHVISHWLGHTSEKSLSSYYNDPAEDARQLDEAMAPVLIPISMAFAGNLLDREEQASRKDDPTSRLEFAADGELKFVGNCGKHSFCATTSVPIPCYRCKHFEPLITAPHYEVLKALHFRQAEEKRALRIGGSRVLMVPIDLTSDIRAVENCINRCENRKSELGIKK